MIDKEQDNANDLNQFNHSDLKTGDEAYLKALEYLRVSKAYIEIRIENSQFHLQDEPNIIQPALIEGSDNALEFVYPIFDFGDRLMASKQSDLEFSSQSMIKMYYTIEKMVAIWYEKLKSVEGGGEVLLYLDGHLLCMRKAFEVIINIPDNWIIMNFDPESWGQQYLSTLNRLRDKNFNFPPSAPRDVYKNPKTNLSPKQRIKK